MSDLERLFPALGVIGAGNMASAILRGTVGQGALPAGQVCVIDAIAGKAEALRDELGVGIAATLPELIERSTTILLAVKPQDLPALLEANAAFFTPRHLLISIAAGLPIARLAQPLAAGVRIVRVMPNTPAMIGAGAAGVAGGPQATAQDVEATLALFRAVGIACQVSEPLIDAVTAVSGSGPAYIFHLMEQMIAAGEALGLPADTARALTLQTFIGAARLAVESGEDPAVLRQKVTSRGGTTAAALAKFDELALGAAWQAGIRAAQARSVELAQAAR